LPKIHKISAFLPLAGNWGFHLLSDPASFGQRPKGNLLYRNDEFANDPLTSEKQD
jgi:hypothetical protein